MCVCVCARVLRRPPATPQLREGSFEAALGKPLRKKLLLEPTQPSVLPKDFMGTSAGSGCPHADRNGFERKQSGGGELRDCGRLRPPSPRFPSQCSNRALVCCQPSLPLPAPLGFRVCHCSCTYFILPFYICILFKAVCPPAPPSLAARQ